MNKKPGLGKRLQYEFDKLFSLGPWMMITGLAIFSFMIVLLSALVLALSGLAPGDEPPLPFSEAFWLSLLQGMGAGSFGGRESVWAFRIVMLLVGLGGIFIISNLIGVITAAIQIKIEQLRKGRSMILETDHTIILGWGEQIFTILPQLVLANSSRGDGCIVILGEEEKTEMEEQIRQRIGPAGRTKIICRSGDPMEMSDLSLTRFNAARAIIVLSPAAPNPDAEVIKTVLAITKHPERRTQPFHIVAGLRSLKSKDIARVVGRDEVEWIYGGEVVARIIAQTCRQVGLSIVYSELLDFNNNEIYFHEEPALAGKTFHEAMLAYEASAVIGLCPQHGSPKINPPMETLIQPGDRLVVISADEDKIGLAGVSEAIAQEELILPPRRPVQRREYTLILDWNQHAADIIHELDQYVARGSEARVVAGRLEVKDTLQRLQRSLRRLRVSFEQGETTDRAVLEGLKLERYDHIILLSDPQDLSIQQADSNTLITLLHLRDLAERDQLSYSIVTEILDLRNSRLAEVARADDFIVSDRLISLMMAQVEENKELNRVFSDLFSHEGSEIYLKPAGEYTRLGAPVSFYTIVEAAARRGEAAFGYRLASAAKDPARAYGVALNPQKSLPIVYGEKDHVIVMAES